MLYSIPSLAVAAVASVPLATALLVAPNSPCSSSCGNTLSSTSPGEMYCDEGTYTSASAGIVYENCVKCEISSTYSAPGGQTDLEWALYNMRFNLGYCLWGDLGNQAVTNNPCITSKACGPLKEAVSLRNYSTSVGTFDYCNSWNSQQVPGCTNCLRELDDGHFLANYIVALEAGCEQQPGNGSTIALQGNLFDTTTPLVIATPSPTYATVPEPDYGPVSLGARVGIAFGGLAFILVLIGFFIVINGKRRRRAFLRDLEKKHGGQGWPHPKTRYGDNGDMLETPASQKPLNGWDSSPVSAHTDGADPAVMTRYFSPYNSNYNSPISATGGGPGTAGGVNWPTLSPQRLNQLIQEQSPAQGSPPPAFTQWPSPTQEKLLMQMHHEQRQNEIAIGVALGGDEASLRSKNSNPSINNNPYTNGHFITETKGKSRDEAYEMHEVESPYNGSNAGSGQYKMPAEPDAPVLHHPGYGRHHVPRPGTGGTTGSGGRGLPLYSGGLTEQDARDGKAV